ncbi:MAG: hypothetical protein IKH77_06925 [Clostridia bacterium]|nr:hypothetical protein [Clostridia bacterium]
MKKILALLLAAMMLMGCCSVFAEGEVPEGYPAIIEGLDFGGADVYIYDWWSDDTRVNDPSEDQQLQYDYQDWIMKTYNVKVHVTALSDWAGNPTELANMVVNKDNSKLCILGISSGFAGGPLANNLYMPWTYGLDLGVFNEATVDFMTKDGVCYGVTMGPKVEPRQGVFFNKAVLEKANINWEELYDLQAANEWTWDKFEEYMDKVVVGSDTNNDGEPDIWALTGNGDDVTISLVVSNEADFFGFNEEGKLVPTIDTDAMKEALARRQAWGEKYMRPNEAWDDYQRFWPEGNVAFFIGQSYEGFNGNSTINQCADDWGFVALPMGPRSNRYTSCADNNVYGIPAVYDEETSLKLQQLFTLWAMPVPGTDEDSWATNFYALTDDRAIEETYAMLREGEHATIMKYNLIGDRNSSITEITWHLGDGSPSEIIEAALPAFQGRCDIFNGDAPAEAPAEEGAGE